MPNNILADEGMWLPMFIKRLNEVDMQEAGLQLTPEELYSINNSSLKDAIVSFGGFCTGELISSQGLLLTNHHCGYDAIQDHSSIENDYLTDGFWAMDKKDELPNPSLYVDFLIKMEDVTQRVLKNVNSDMSEEERLNVIDKEIKVLKNENSNDNNFIVQVKSFFAGNEYYMFIYERFSDVRLVGAPPSSIGKYGGDTDNWMWPRHTGDFSMFRVYASKDGQPSKYSEDNVPLTKELRQKNNAFYHHLPVSIKGVENGDFTMVWGYPGSTDRFLTSYGVNQLLNITAPTIVDIRDLKLGIMKKYMDSDEEIRIKYSSKYARTANYWKYYIGQSKGLKKLGIYDKKKEIEDDFDKFSNLSKENIEEYGQVLNLFESSYNSIDSLEKSSNFLSEVGIRGTDIVLFVYRASRIINSMINSQEENEKEKLLDNLKKMSLEHFKNFDYNLDKEQFYKLFQKYFNEVSPEFYPDFFEIVDKKYKNNWKKFSSKLYENSIFTNQDKFIKFLNSPNKKSLDRDLANIVSSSVISSYFSQGGLSKDANLNLSKANRLFIKGLKEMNPEIKYYPDANFSMRTTYGKIGDYIPSDGVHYDFKTTLDGVIEKYLPNDFEFDLPEKLINLYNEKDYGEYADSSGNLIVNFIHNTDITGGNSGSPVLNSEGHLIGTAFDGNWEAMSGDIAFESEIQRTISCDIRYVLFIIDKYANAGHLVKEMDIVK
ncbi:MAG: serine protease [Flavobacteriales bacterium]|nr:serine protease [Flavobacteriales bacterium]|tara:strand:+ start:4140 stop:6278 length:2139 start_codon:yes stop_codon:yes gene_type:complete